MSTGLATRRALDRAARQHADEERRAVEMLAGLVVLAVVAVAGTLVVLLVGAVVDTWTGLDHVAQLLRAVRGVE